MPVSPTNPYGPQKRSRGWIWWLLAIILILAAGFGGWWYANDQATTDKVALQRQIDDLKAQLAKAKSDDSSTKPDFVITQWGVGFSIKGKSDLAGLKYELSSDGTKATLYTDTQRTNCQKAGASFTGFGLLRRSATDPSVDTGGAGMIKATKLGSYYYYSDWEQAPCAADQNGGETEANQLNELRSAAAKLAVVQ